MLNKWIAIGERYMHTDLRYLLGGGSWLFLGQLVGIGTSLFLAIGYAHFLSMETYGTYKYVLSIFGLLSIFTLPSMETAAIRGISRGHDGIFWDSLRYRITGGAIASIVCFAIAVYYFFSEQILLATVFLISAPLLIALDPSSHYAALLQGKKLFRQTAIYSIILQLGVGVLLFLAILLSDNLIILIATFLVANIALRILFFIITVRTSSPNTSKDEDSLVLGKHMSVAVILGTISSRLDAILLFHFLGPAALAIYSFSKAATDNLQSAFKLINGTLAFPKFAAQDKEVLKKTLWRKVLIAHAFTIPISIAVILAIPYLYRFAFPAYTESIIYAQVMLVFLAFSPVRFISTAITAQAPIRLYYAVALTNPIVLSMALFICVPIWGIWGAIAASAAQQIIGNAIAFYVFKRM